MTVQVPVRKQCVGEALDEAARLWGERIGWTFEDSHVSFVQMAERSREVARGLVALGVGPGDVVATWIPNLAEFAYCLFACARIGAVVTAINTRSRQFELEHVLGHSDAKALIMCDRFLRQDFVGTIAGLLGDGAMPGGGDVASASYPKLHRLVAVAGSQDSRLMPWDVFLAAGRTAEFTHRARLLEAARRPDDPVLLQYTSGTTALPKGALCDHAYVLNLGAQNMTRLGVGAGDPVLNTQPFYHVGGSCGAVPTPLVLGCRVVVPEYYDVERVLTLIDREKCMARTGFAAMYIMEMDHPRFREFDLSSLRAGWCIGPPELMEQVRDRMGVPGLVQIYGATEACGTSGDIDDPWDKRSRTCGRALDGVEVAIMGPAGDMLPANASGEIVMRGWCCMRGYLKQPDETARTKDTAGWIHSGDYGLLDDDGYLHFQGRIKNMIRVGGENVSAEEVEAMLMRHPAIKMAAAIPYPDARLDEVVLAIVEVHDGMTLSDDDVKTYCRDRMANFRVPREVRFVREWPLTGSGKIHRHELLARFGRPPG